ncbi:MAG: nucleotide-diphospho-sugar transferase [Bacteroidales bacterium]|nr:nucleotide-diphospho-sugar transferase [Bacteroidales bacterium]
MYNIPILLIIFNRLDTTEKVFEEIRKQKPKYLYIAGDGPRIDRKDDIENCKITRSIIEKIDWDCELKTLFREENLGCGKAVSGAVTWFFDNVEMGIILEDDCLPHKDFFPYCEELLIRYKDNKDIKMISGDNFQNRIQRGNASYYFTAYTHIWGWATWKRTWDEYDFNLNNLSKQDFKNTLKQYFSSWQERQIWLDKFILMKKKLIDTWDYQFTFNVWEHKGVNIMPNVNLISNIGFGKNSTHTNDDNNVLANLPLYPILPINHPNEISINKEADRFSYKSLYKKTLIRIFYRRVLRLFK